MATAKELTHTGENTVIGQSILISGKLTGDEDLTVQGRVEGELTLTRTLIVEPSGVVKANVAVRNAIVSGVVVGNINATESVELTREGRMVGDIKAPRVIIVDGASFRGRVDMGEVEPGRLPVGDRPRIQPVRPQLRPGTTTPVRPPIPATPSGRIATPVAPPARPAVTTPARAPAPPPPPTRSEPKVEAKAPPPPAAPVMAAGAKKKVIIKKKR